MDKYEFNIKVEQIKKMVSRGDYGTAMKIADTIDWHRVRNASLLSMIAQIYEKNEEYQEAKDILLLAFERAPVGKRLLYKLADLALKDGSTAEAEAYYREFCDLAQDDPRQYLLRYKILKAKKAPVDQLIRALEVYTASEVDEKWLYELADLYKYQMDLVENRDKYEAKLRAVEEEYSGNAPELDDYDEGTPDSEASKQVAMQIHEDAQAKKLADEMSRLSEEEGRTAVVEEDDDMGATRTIADLSQVRRGGQAAAPEVQEEENTIPTGEDRKLRKMRRERKNRSTRSRQRKSVRSSARSWRSAPQKSGKRWKRKLSAVLRKSGKPPDARKRNAVRRSRRRSTANVPAETRSATSRLRKRRTTMESWSWNPWMTCWIPTT